MKFTTIIFLLVLPILSIYAQPKKEVLGITVNSGTEVKGKGGMVQLPVGIIKDKIITFGRKGRTVGGGVSRGGKCQYNVWNTNSELIKSEKQEEKTDDVKLGIDDFKRSFVIDGKIIQLTSSRNGNYIDLGFTTIDTEDFTIESFKKVADFHLRDGGQGFYKIITTHDQKHFAFCIFNAKENQTEIAVLIYDRSLKLKHKIVDLVPFKSLELTISDIHINDEGKVLFLLKQNENLKSLNGRLNGRPFYANVSYNKILYYFDASNGLQRALFEKEEYNYKSCRATLIDNKIYLSGIFTTSDTPQKTGSYFIELSNELKLLNEKYEDFSFDFTTQHFTKKETKYAKEVNNDKKAYNWSDYKTIDIFPQKDGFIQYTERANIESYRIESKLSHSYKYFEIILVKYDLDGTVKWKKTIPKRMYSYNDLGFAVKTYYKIVEDNVYFIYKDKSPQNGTHVGVSKLNLTNDKLESKILYSTDGTPSYTGETTTPGKHIIDIDEKTALMLSYYVTNGRANKNIVINTLKF